MKLEGEIGWHEMELVLCMRRWGNGAGWVMYKGMNDSVVDTGTVEGLMCGWPIWDRWHGSAHPLREA